MNVKYPCNITVIYIIALRLVPIDRTPAELCKLVTVLMQSPSCFVWAGSWFITLFLMMQEVSEGEREREIPSSYSQGGLQTQRSEDLSVKGLHCCRIFSL